MSEKGCEEKLVQGVQLKNGTAITVTTQENAIKKFFDKKLSTSSAFDFFEHPVCPYELKEDLIVRLDLNFPEKLILCGEDTAATYTLSDISLKFDTIFDERYQQ